MSSINLFPQIDDITLETVLVSSKRFYHYRGSDGLDYTVEEKTLKGFEDKDIFELEDENSEYDQSTDTLFLDFEFTVKNAKYLFGSTGYVFDDSVIGVGLEWKSRKSKIRHCKFLGSFDKNSSLEPVVFKVTNIELNELKSDTDFSWIFFIQKPGTAINGIFFANKEGLIVGKKPLWTIKGEGEGSIFPIIETTAPGEPLWSVKTSFEDPYSESFSLDYVRILINKQHPDYKFIQSTNKDYNVAFLKEVLASSIFMLIKEIEYGIDDFKTMKDKHYENGSIVQALMYFEKELDFKIHESSVNLMKSIKLFVDKTVLD